MPLSMLAKLRHTASQLFYTECHLFSFMLMPFCWILLSWMSLRICYNAKCQCAECHCAECHCAECHYAECQCAECHYAECHYAECHYVEMRLCWMPLSCCKLNYFLIIAIKLSGIMLNVIVPNVALLLQISLTTCTKTKKLKNAIKSSQARLKLEVISHFTSVKNLRKETKNIYLK